MYTRNKCFCLPIALDNQQRAAFQEVQLYVKKGAAAPWTLIEIAAPTRTEFTFCVPEDGEYWFAIATVKKNTKLTAVDIGRLTPGLIVIVDTQPPEIAVEPVPSKSVGTGMFVIGTTKVRPRVPPSDGKPAMFKRGQKVNFWMQVYNLSVDEKTHKPSATFEYDIVNATTNKQIVHAVESSEKMGNLSDQVTLQKTVAAANLDPGVYRIQIKVSDNISKQSIDPTATFAVQ